MSNIKELFEDAPLISIIKAKLPNLFCIAELESSRAGKIGMEVGSLREKIIIALLIHKFGSENIDTNIPITEPETDVKLSNVPISIKTITGNGGVKAVWTVDAESARIFIQNYCPKCDIILAQLKWNTRDGGLFLIPLTIQQEIFSRLGRDRYLKMPRAGTNPRGVEFSKEAITLMIAHNGTSRIRINWTHEDITYDPYKRWVDYWEES